MEMRKIKYLSLACLTVFVAGEYVPVVARSQAVEVLKYFNPVPQKSYLNEKQDRLIKKKSFKVNVLGDVEPVRNQENGIFAELSAVEATDLQHVANVISNPGIDGISTVLTWRELEPAEAEYNFKPVDDLIELMNRYKKGLILRVSTAGVNIESRCDTPQWVFEDGAKRINYYGSDGKQATMPIFWDQTYLARWSNFVKELGKNYDGNPTMHSIGITGGGMLGGTPVVPESENVTADRSGTDGKAGYEALTKRLTEEFGMSQKQLIDHWKYVADLFPAAFTKTRLNFDIDATTPNRAGQNALDEISDYLIYRYGQRIFLTRQNVSDGKHGFEQYRVIIKFRPDTFTGYQLTGKVSPADLQKISHTALDDGVSFMEVPEKIALSADEQVKSALAHLRSHMGYQLLLNRAVIPQQVKTGATVDTSFGFVNLGDSVPACPERTFDKDVPESYRVELEFRNASNKLVGIVLHTPEVSTLQWAAGKPIQWDEPLKMPSMKRGKYAVSLALVNSNAGQRINFLNGLDAGREPVVTNVASLGTVEFK